MQCHDEYKYKYDDDDDDDEMMWSLFVQIMRFSVFRLNVS